MGAIVAGALTACAAVLGIDEGHPRDDGGSDGALVGDGALAGDGACEAIGLDESIGLFVATDGEDGTSCGGRTAPCRTVQKGIDRAHDVGKGAVYVARGTYVEAITLRAGVTVSGGWDVVKSANDAAWSRACTPSATVIQMPASETVAVRAAAIGGQAKLSTLAIVGKGAADVKAGESLIGVLATGGTAVDLVAVSVTMGDAGSGATGATGATGASGGPCDAGGDGAPATQQGGKGDGADGGWFDPALGFVPGSGGTGKQGASGENGSPPTKGTCVDCRTCQSGAVCVDVDAGVSCGTDGTPGCGGAGGLGGGGGGGGGSSVAVLAWGGAQVVVSGGALVAGNGGRGALGGDGGVGGGGTVGGAGKDTATCPVTCGGVIALGCVADSDAGRGGAAGGRGGSGAPGGPGGEGAGGDSFAIVRGDGANVTTSGTALVHGRGGDPGGPAAATGREGDVGP